LRSSVPLPAGKSIRCSRCRAKFRTQDAINTLFPLTPAAATADDALSRTPGPLPFAPPSTPTPQAPACPGYRVLGELGRGAMGMVYKAVHERLRRVVALKVVRAEVVGLPDEHRRLLSEGELAARLHHPNVVQVYDLGEAGGQVFVALEYVAGGTLQQRLAGGTPQPVRPAVQLVATLTAAAHAAHTRGLIHRDLKPANILLAPRRADEPPPDGPDREAVAEYGVPKIADFGLACRADSDTLPPHLQLAGTPQYMAPEQAGGRVDQIDRRADVYALGGILYEMLTGRPPFTGPSLADVLTQLKGEPPPPPRAARPDLPRDLEAVVLKCLAKRPADRYPTAQALADDLTRFLNGESVAARPLSPAGRGLRWARRNRTPAALLVASLVTVACALGWFWWLADRLVCDTAVDGGRQQLEVLDEVRKIHADIRNGSRVVPSTSAWIKPDATGYDQAVPPAPAHVITHLGERIHAGGWEGVGKSGTSDGRRTTILRLQMYSNYPMRDRGNVSPPPAGSFGQRALGHFRHRSKEHGHEPAAPSPPPPGVIAHGDPQGKSFYYEIGDCWPEFDNRRVLRYAIPMLIDGSCTSCHNNPKGPFKGLMIDPANSTREWKDGEARGSLELVRYLDRQEADTRGKLLWSVAGLLALGAAVFAAVRLALRSTDHRSGK
jgi:serine/threonine protein kinase